MTTFRDYPVRLVDVSQYQDNPDTAYKPELDMLQALGVQGFIVRVGYGLVEDRAFKWFWSESKGKFKRKTYWYGDYYSNRYMTTTDAEWGDIQAETCWNLLKSDQSSMPLALDCEASTYGGLISAHRASFNTIMKNFCESYDVLSGKYTEIYTSPSLLSSFDDWAKDRTLWIAWYNKLISYQNIVDAVKAAGWRGKVIIWQYASDGDINNDGIPEGLVLGFETKGLDLNVFLGTVDEWDLYSGGEVTNVIPEKDPNALFLAKCIQPVDTRNEFGVDIKMDLAVGDYVNVYEERSDGMWRIAPLDIQRWVVSGSNYMEKIVPPPPPPPAFPEMFKAVCIKPEGVDTRNELGVDIKQDLHFADIVSVYAIDLVNKMWRIAPLDIQRWVVSGSNYMLKLAPPEQKPIFSDAEKASLRAIRDAHPELDIKQN